jgi:hypothetical protein
MFETGHEFIMWQTYRDRVREAEKNRLVRQVPAGHRRRVPLLSWAPAWLERRSSAPGTKRTVPLRGPVEEAAKASKASGGLIL